MENQFESNEIQTIKGELEESRRLILSLKRKIGGYMRSNENYRNQVSELKARVEHYKFLDLEGDQLYKKKIAECEHLNGELDEAKQVANNVVPITKFAELEQSLESKNYLIDSLQNKVQDLMIEKSQLENKVSSLTVEQTELYETIEYLRLPWYKRLFK